MLLLLLVTFSAAPARTATLSNEELPLDQNGRKIITGEASVLVHEGSFYFYFNDWGDCPGVDCCDSDSGCASCCFDHPPHPMQACSNPYGTNHSVHVYDTLDLMTWRDLGVALPLTDRAPGIEFRPCVVYNAATQLFVMWYEDRGVGEHGYAVAVSPTPAGPFITTHTNVDMPGRGRVGDFNIFVDDDGTAYHVRTGFDLVRLNANYTGPDALVSSFTTPKSSEGPAMFKRNGTYYITAGTGCCACIGGSTIYVLTASSLAGPWTYRGDVGSNPTPFDPHSPNNYVTRAQGSAVLQIGGNGPSGQTIWLGACTHDATYAHPCPPYPAPCFRPGNQWNSGLLETPPGPRNHDLLYWALLSFDADGAIEQLTRQRDITVVLSPCGGGPCNPGPTAAKRSTSEEAPVLAT